MSADPVALQLRLLLERQVSHLGRELAAVLVDLPAGFLLVFRDDADEGRVGFFATKGGERAARIWLNAGRALEQPVEVRDLGRALDEHIKDEIPAGVLYAFLLWLHDLPIFYTGTIPMGEVRQILRHWLEKGGNARP